jgi:hypothetical protein
VCHASGAKAYMPEVECLDDDLNDAAFIWATSTIGGRYTVDEYVACKLYPLATDFIFKSMPVGRTLLSKVEICLSLFAVVTIVAEHADHFLAEMEMYAERVLGSFRPREYNAVAVANILIGGHPNRVFEQMGVLYAPRPLTGSEASQAANNKRKAEVSKKSTAKKAKAGAG